MGSGGLAQSGTVKAVYHDSANGVTAPRQRLFSRAHLLAELRKGPVETLNWRSVATTRKALQVRVHQLREAGYDIESVAQPNHGVLRTSVPAVAYRLRGEPCCTACGK